MKSCMGLPVEGIGGVRLGFPKGSGSAAVIRACLVFFLGLAGYNDGSRSLGGFIDVVS